VLCTAAHVGPVRLTAEEVRVLSLPNACVVLAAVAFVAAIVTNFIGDYFATAEGYSRASANLALLAIAIVLCFRDERR
jgi:hypothetical protein